MVELPFLREAEVLVVLPAALGVGGNPLLLFYSAFPEVDLYVCEQRS